jgi:hypothetical protein
VYWKSGTKAANIEAEQEASVKATDVAIVFSSSLNCKNITSKKGKKVS